MDFNAAVDLSKYLSLVGALVLAVWYLKNTLEKRDADRDTRDAAERKLCMDQNEKCELQYTDACKRIQELENRGYEESRSDKEKIMEALRYSSKAISELAARGFTVSQTPPGGNRKDGIHG